MLEVAYEPKAVLAFDTETTPRWWWFDGKATNRTMMFVGQWVDEHDNIPFGWILVPDVIMTGLTRARAAEYNGLPLRTRREALRLIRYTIGDADVLVGHNIKGFDIGGLNGELMLENLPLLPKVDVIDTLKDGPRGVQQSRSLQNRTERIGNLPKKPNVPPVVWEAAFHDFEPAALRQVWERAVTDVQLHIDLLRNDLELGYIR